MSGNPFGCRYCEERLQLFMDKVLTDEEIVEVQHHLDDCPPCRGAYRFEATLRMVVHDRTIEPRLFLANVLEARKFVHARSADNAHDCFCHAGSGSLSESFHLLERFLSEKTAAGQIDEVDHLNGVVFA